MRYESLSDYVDALDETGQLIHVDEKVNPKLEIAEIMRSLMYKGINPQFCLKTSKDHIWPVLGNAFGTIKRLQLAPEASDFTEIGNRVTDLTRMKIPSSVIDKLRICQNYLKYQNMVRSKWTQVQ